MPYEPRSFIDLAGMLNEIKDIPGSLILAGHVFNAFSTMHSAAHMLVLIVIGEDRNLTTKSRKREVFSRADIRD